MTKPDTQPQLLQADIRALHDMLLQLLMESSPPTTPRDSRAFLLLAECVQRMQAAIINLSTHNPKPESGLAWTLNAPKQNLDNQL